MALSSFLDGRLWGARYGSGRPWVVALPGWGRDHNDFSPVLSGLDAVALDLPGFGASPEPPEPWSSVDYAELVAKALDELGGAVVLVGHSFGARVAARLAGDRRVRALVLSGAPMVSAPAASARRPALAFRAARALHKRGLVAEARMERLRRRYGSYDYAHASPVMRAVLVKAVEETARSAYLPALRAFAEGGGTIELVWGEADSVAPLAGLLQALQGLPEGSVRATVVPGAGHLLSPAVCEELRAALLRQRGRL